MASSEVRPINDLLMEIVLPENRTNINIIPAHITVLRGSKSTKQISRKKITKKSSTLTRKQYAQLGLYNLPSKGIIYEDYLPLHKLWKSHIKEFLSLSNKDRIPEVTDPAYDSFSKLLVKCELHGAIITVTKSKCPNFIGISGIVILDTKNTFKIICQDNKIKTIPKADCIFTVKLGNLCITIFGKHITIRSAERSVKKIKNIIEPDL